MTQRSFALSMRNLGLAAALAVGGIAMVGCTTTPAGSEASGPSARAAMDSQVDSTLARLYTTVPGSRELVQRSAGTLVFPAVVGGSFVVGAEYGRGALREGGRSTAYYSTTAGSVGLQAGGQSKAVIYVFTTPESLQKFKNSRGWTAGADATVAAGKIGANGVVDTQTAQQPVASFILTNVGLEAGAAVGGAKITQINL